MSVTHGQRKTPHVALLVGGVLGFALAYLLWEAGNRDLLGGNLSAALLSMAVFGAVISYFMQALSFVLLRRRLPNIERPYRSPVGEWGALIAAAIALVTLIAIFWNSDYRPGVYGVALFYLVAVLYFALIGRHKLVYSPEEEFAMSHGERAGPHTEATATHHGGGLEAQMDEAPSVSGEDREP